MSNDIVILGGARTAIGTFGGALAATPPSTLGSIVARAAMERAGVDPSQIGHVVFGNVINTEPRDMYLSRVAAREAGVPDEVPAMNVNRLCGSGVQALVSATQSLMLGDADFALAGGAESMSRAPYILPDARWGQKMGDVRSLDMLLGTLNCPFGTGHMGVTAENVADEHNITREDQDAFALLSQERAQIEAVLDDVEVAAGWLPKDLPERMPRLQWLQLWSAGADWLPRHPALVAHPVVVTTAVGIHGVQIGEHVFATLLALARDLPKYVLAQHERRWRPADEARPRVFELHGRTLLVVGVGAIGARVAKLGSAFGMRVMGVRRQPERAVAGVERMVGEAELDAVLPQADGKAAQIYLTSPFGFSIPRISICSACQPSLRPR